MEKLNDKIISFLRFFWKFGYEPTEIKNSKYLPTPKNIGNYEIDIVAKKQGQYCIGIILKNSEFENLNLLVEKITFLSSLKNKNDKKEINLFVACDKQYFEQLKKIILFIPQKYVHKIKIFYLN
ncbi:MAG TPA: hypothetical protein PK887_04840 [Ignavibacteriales bacterium]|nr:hypothetical protein [Ignavibacteriales bacterium]